MEYFILTKIDKIWTWKPAEFVGGYSFKRKTKITLYNYDMIRFILLKKLNNSLKNIINLYLLYETDDSEDGIESLMGLIPKVETLRAILIENYATYLTETEIESYLMKFDRLEEKIDSTNIKKSRSM